MNPIFFCQKQIEKAKALQQMAMDTGDFDVITQTTDDIKNYTRLKNLWEERTDGC